MHRTTWTVTVAGIALLLAGCGGGGATDDAAGDGDGEAVATVATASTDLGEVLVDGDGMTLYLFDSDPEDGSACTDGCAETWPPLPGPASAGEGVTADELGTIERPDGSTQATYAGHPLYHYAPDEAPGDVTGQGVGGVWWVLAPDGTAIRDDASSATTGADTPAY